MMKKTIDIAALLAPIPGENSAGTSLRYDPVYDELQEARRADDLLDRGDWQHEIKVSDWDKVFNLCVSSLTERSKDLQIGVWLLEALSSTEGFEGLHAGLQVMTGLLQQFWDNVYPEIEDDDLDYRAGPLEFLNDKVWLVIKQIPLTDPKTTPGYSWLQWQESRQESSAAGKISAEDFDRAVRSCSKSFYQTLSDKVAGCLSEFQLFDQIVDEKFGREAPRLAELRTALDDCNLLVSRILKEKKEQEPDSVDSPPPAEEVEVSLQDEPIVSQSRPVGAVPPVAHVPHSSGSVASYRVNRLLSSTGIEEIDWQEALEKLKSEGIKPALEQLLGASCSAQSVREQSNFRLLMAMLCLKANRPDLARPIVEELNTLMEELQLSKWESPIWVAEVLDTLYQCLSAAGASEDDVYRSKEILKKICTLDVTKAMGHMSL